MRKARNRTSYRPKAWRERGGEVGRKYDNVVKSESIMLPSFPDNLEGISKRNCKKRTREEKTGKKQKKQQKKKVLGTHTDKPLSNHRVQTGGMGFKQERQESKSVCQRKTGKAAERTQKKG